MNIEKLVERIEDSKREFERCMAEAQKECEEAKRILKELKNGRN